MQCFLHQQSLTRKCELVNRSSRLDFGRASADRLAHLARQHRQGLRSLESTVRGLLETKLHDVVLKNNALLSTPTWSDQRFTVLMAFNSTLLTFSANRKLQSDSLKLDERGLQHTIASVFEFPPREFCKRNVSFDSR